MHLCTGFELRIFARKFFSPLPITAPLAQIICWLYPIGVSMHERQCRPWFERPFLTCLIAVIFKIYALMCVLVFLWQIFLSYPSKVFSVDLYEVSLGFKTSDFQRRWSWTKHTSIGLQRITRFGRNSIHRFTKHLYKNNSKTSLYSGYIVIFEWHLLRRNHRLSFNHFGIMY